MKKLNGPGYTDSQIYDFLNSETRSEGLINKKSLESLENVFILYRPFRIVTINLSGTKSNADQRKTTHSLIDEDFAGSFTDENHMFLLWRPRLANLIEDIVEEDEETDLYPGNEDGVKEVLNELVDLRWRGQEEDEELRSALRSLQVDPLSSIAFVVPRSPGGLRREEEILEKRKSTHAYVVASSLVVNCSPKDIVVSAVVGERVYIETVVAEYKDLESDSTRLLLLETPGTSSLKEAKKAGGALTRLCQLYDSCVNRIYENVSL
ncbi:MAG: hypothetical protein ACFFDM_06540 [Candidatus Thorarchaeota archaeon]